MSETPPAPSPSRRLPKIGEVNILEATFGNRGEGKSMSQAIRTYELQRQHGGAYVIGHSIGRRVPKRFPAGIYGGHTLPVRYYRSIEDMHRGLMKHPTDWHFVAPPLPEEDPYPDLPKSSADELIRYAVRLSWQVRWAAWKRANPMALATLLNRPPKNGVDFDGIESPPIILVIDEGIAVRGAAVGKRIDDEWFLSFLISLRHLNIILLWSLQDPTMKTWHVIGQASLVRVFYLENEWVLNAIRVAGASREQLQAITELDQYEHIVLTFGRDRVENKRKAKEEAAKIERDVGAGSTADPTAEPVKSGTTAG